MRNASQGMVFVPLQITPQIIGLEVIEPKTDLDSRLAWFEYQRALTQLHRKWSQMRLLAFASQTKAANG